MTLANVALYLALIVFIVVRRMIGRPIGAAKQQFVLPGIIIFVGWGDATKGLHKSFDIGITVVGCAVSLVLGALRGGADRVSVRDGAPYVQWTWLSLALFATNLLVKLGLDVFSISTGETGSAVGRSLLLSLGLTLLGEAAVVWYRSGGANPLTFGETGGTDRRWG